jgi:hypothetical protein
MATIEIRRSPSGWRDAARSYKILVDEEEVGRVRRGEAARLPLGPGAHVVQLKADWKRSAQFTLNGDADEVFRFRCGPRSGVALIDLFNRRDDTWMFLEPDVPRV